MTRWKTVEYGEIGKSHAVFFEREYEEDWGYMGMRDYKTYEPTDAYGITVVPYDICGNANNTDGGYVRNSFCASGFGKDMANRIWWNLKNGINYETLRDALKEYITRER